MSSVTGDIEGDDERFVFAGKHGFGVANRQTGEWKYIKPAWTEEEMNEGKDSKSDLLITFGQESSVLIAVTGFVPMTVVSILKVVSGQHG